MHFNSPYILNPTFYLTIALCGQYSVNIHLYLSIYLLFLLLSISSYNCMFFFGVIFLVSEERSLVFLLVQVFWQKSFSFYLPEHIYISPSFLKDNLSRHRILGWWILSFSIYKSLFYCLCTSILSIEKLAVSLTAASLKVISLFSDFF